MIDAVKRLNTGKAPDAYGVTTENIIYACDTIYSLLSSVYNAIFRLHSVPDILKLGTVSPVFKKKGSKLEAKNSKGITVLPVLAKLLEILLRSRIRRVLDPQQNPLQRGFTAGSSPLNCSLIIEEFIREAIDKGQTAAVALLDAKAAFDVVNHTSLLRKLYIAGIEGNLWNVINSLQQNAISSVKWRGELSNTFPISQGVRQGGILSADMYKLYVNTLSDRIQDSGIGGHIGDINCSAPTCADDMSQLSNNDQDLQILCNIAKDYSDMEKYSLQPTKSVVLPINTSGKRKMDNTNRKWTLGDDPMPTVDKAVHVSVTRTTKPNAEAAIEENIQKARRTLYSLMATGLHGENGLDPNSAIHLLRVYVMPVLLYGLEVQLPNTKTCHPIEIFLKKTLKQILSLPITTADPAPYILSGILPAEAFIHQHALTFFGNICRLSNTCIEKRLAIRQCSLKSMDSNSWFSSIKKLLIQYDLPQMDILLYEMPSKYVWSRKVKEGIDTHWHNRILCDADLYSSLQYRYTLA